MRRNIHTRRLWWLAAFSIAMGFLESAVVVYLRALYYPDGFLFPLVPMESSLAITEVWREVCTIVMLFAVGFMVTKIGLVALLHLSFASGCGMSSIMFFSSC